MGTRSRQSRQDQPELTNRRRRQNRIKDANKTWEDVSVTEEPVGEQIVNAKTGSHLPDNRAGGIPNPQVVGNE